MSERSGSSNTAPGGGIGFCGVLAIVFITLKLCHTIDWSWWWVTAPLWLPIAAILAFIGFCLLMAALTGQLRRPQRKNPS